MEEIFEYDDSLCYAYGHDRQRILMEEHVCGLTRTKQYWGACEYVTESDGSNTSSLWRTFVAGPYGVFAVVESHNGINDPHYVLKDNLGSWTTVTDGNGTVEQRLSYDAWGNLRDPNTWANYTVGDSFAKPMFDRGFTGHEHLTDFGLINMNGRVYDPLMSSFLSADRFVQNPLTAQGFNRYSYCMNNPLRFIDPTGWAPRPGGSGPSIPPPYVVIDGWGGHLLNEVTITDSFYEEFEYTPYYCTGGSNDIVPPWSDAGNVPSIRPSDTGCGGGNGNHRVENTPQEGTPIHSGDALFFKTFLRYQIGALNQLGIISEDFWVDAATININESDIRYREKEDDYVVNLFNDGDLMQGLALGHLVLNKVDDYEYTIQPDEYDFRIESYRSLGGNVATFLGWGIHQYGMAPFLPKGTYTIRFYGTVTVKQ